MHFAAALFVLLALTQDVFCSFFSVSFSQVKQCGSFTVNFTGVPGSTPPALPLTLTIVPFNSNPILIPIPFGNWDNTTFKGTAEITFLPFDDGTQFVASLDDANGEGMGLVSDVIGVMQSSDSSCLPFSQGGNNGHGGGGNKGAKTDFYDFRGDFSQCSTFNVTFDPTDDIQAPTIRAFLPRSFAFPINATRLNSSGNQEYMLDVFHGFQAVLLLDDGVGHAETSGLFTTGGDISSPKDCFPFDTVNQTTQVSAADTTTQTAVMSKDAKIIVAAACVVVVLLVGIIMAIFIQRKRFRNKQFRSPTSSTKSFVFTEDVDMGSSFIGRVYGRLSQFWGSNFSASGEKRSYRSFPDDEKSVMPYSYDGSYGIATSPRGSLVPPKSRPISEKESSWNEVERMLGEKHYEQGNRIFYPFSSTKRDGSPFDNRTSHPPNPPFPLPVIDPPNAVRIRDSAPDAPLPAVPRSPSADLKYGSGFGFGSMRSSRSASYISSYRHQRSTSGSSFGNLDVSNLNNDMNLAGSSSESSFGNRLIIKSRESSNANTTSQSNTPSQSSLHSSQFPISLAPTRIPGERVNVARAPPFPTSPICSRRTSRTSR